MTEALYHPGCRILVRGEEWQISEASKKKISGGNDVFEITAIGLTGIVRGQEFCFISCIDEIKLLNPADIEPVQDASANAGCAKAYLEAHLRRLLPRNGALYLGQHGAVEAFPYQLEPASKALHMIRPRIIIGDAVGVGKTIECGILLAELIRRGKGKRILCVVPKATLEQFQNEMWGRFSIGLHRLDSIGLQKLRQNLPSSMNPFYHFDKVIISLDTLKIESYSRLLKECNWDVVVIDEAHNVTNRTDGMAGSLRHKVAKTLSSRARSLVLMSATPHDGTSLGFSSLVRLVDPTAISNDEKYDAESVKSCFIRRTRSQIKSQTGDQKPRKTYITEVPLSIFETSILQDLHDLKIEPENIQKGTKDAGLRGGKFRELFKTTLLKSYLSSPAALEETLTKKLKGLNSKSNEFAAYETILKKLKGNAETASCLLALKKLLTSEKLTSESRVVVFTERLATLKNIVQFLLNEKLATGLFDPTKQSQADAKENLVAVADGSLRERDLQAVVKAFQNVNSGLRILVASNVAAEGLNLHTTCHRLIHFDLPWSFITLEQRNGRIDRLGQKRTPEIHYLAAVAEGKDMKNAKAIKDDFWVVNKLKARQALAAKDLDEEALSMGFVSGTDEAEFNTQAYEGGSVQNSDVSSNFDDFLANIMCTNASNINNSGSESDDLKVTKKVLATLYPNAPKGFVLEACTQLGLKTRTIGTLLSIELNSEFKRECELWPSEFRPSDDLIALESDAQKMAEYYQSQIREGLAFDKSFLNEIHPGIALLESACLHLFPGEKVPLICTTEQKQGSVTFLCQGTAFNNCNEVVFQAWDAITFPKGSGTGKALFESVAGSHDKLLELTQWLQTQLASVSRAPTKTSAERIKSLAQDALEIMQRVVETSRNSRAEHSRKLLREESQRIRNWESRRREYLDEVIGSGAKPQLGQPFHLGLRAKAELAKKESAVLGEESKQLASFVSDILATQPHFNLQILCIFVGEGK